MTSSESDRAAVAALDEPTRRRVYEHVVDSATPIGRDEVAAELALPRTTAAFHLERLAEEGLLEATYARRSGRSGPGAGRPAKLYQRSDREFSVSIPPRQYEWAGRLLAGAIEESVRSGEPVGELLERHAYDAGIELGRSAAGRNLETTLEEYGFEPRPENTDLVLGNCPFRTLASDFPGTVCGMNVHLMRGLLDGLDAVSGLDGRTWSAKLDPDNTRCCVRLAPGED